MEPSRTLKIVVSYEVSYLEGTYSKIVLKKLTILKEGQGLKLRLLPQKPSLGTL